MPVVGFVVAIGWLAIGASVVWGGDQDISVEGATVIVRSAVLSLAVAFAVLMFPAAVLSLHLAARVPTASPIGRAIIGSVSFGGWYVLLGATVLIAGTFGIWPDGFVALLLLVASAGAAFTLLAVRGRPAPPGWLATGAGTVGACLLITACFVTAGWWGSAAS
jgi:hypothetical protein